MPSFPIQVLGTTELVARIRALDDITRQQVMVAATQVGAMKTVNRAKQIARTKDIYQTGTLIRDIHQVEIATTSMTCTVSVGNLVPYARRQELGWPAGKADSLGRVAKVGQAARPYLRPALLETKDQVKTTVGKALGLAIMKVAKKP